MYVGVSLKAGRNPGFLILQKPKETFFLFQLQVKQQLLGLAAAQFPFCSNPTKAALQSLSASEGKVNALLVP